MKGNFLQMLGLLHLPVQQNNEASDDLRKMQARTLIYKVMVASPVLFMGMISAEGRFSADSFDFDTATRRQHQNITAYIAPVRDAKEILGDDVPSREALHEAASIWLKGYRSGELRPLTPAFHGDSIREGIKGQIKSTNDRMISGLTGSFKVRLREGDRKAALEDAILALQLSEILKYSDAFSVSSTGIQQRSILAVVRANMEKFDASERKSLLACLTQIKKSQEPLHEIVRQAQWLYVLDCEKKGVQPLQIEDPSMDRAKKSASAAGARRFDARMLGEKILHAEDLTEMPTLYSELRMAITSQRHLLQTIDEISASLSTSAE